MDHREIYWLWKKCRKMCWEGEAEARIVFRQLKFHRVKILHFVYLACFFCVFLFSFSLLFFLSFSLSLFSSFVLSPFLSFFISFFRSVFLSSLPSYCIKIFTLQQDPHPPQQQYQDTTVYFRQPTIRSYTTKPSTYYSTIDTIPTCNRPDWFASRAKSSSSKTRWTMKVTDDTSITIIYCSKQYQFIFYPWLLIPLNLYDKPSKLFPGEISSERKSEDQLSLWGSEESLKAEAALAPMLNGGLELETPPATPRPFIGSL